MNSYAHKTWKFEVYGPFNCILASYPFNQSETHHSAGSKARKACNAINQQGRKAWVRLVKHS